MNLKGMAIRPLGLLVVLLTIAACGSSGATTPSNTSSSATSSASSAPTAETPAATMAAATEAATAAMTTAAEVTPAATAAMTTATQATAAATAAMPAATETTVATTAAGGATTGPIANGNGATIKIGSKNFTEEFIVAEMYAQLLEANGFKVERKLNLGAEQIAHQALVNKEIDLYPEYTSTGLLVILNMPPQNDPQQIYNTVKSEYEKRFQVTWLKPSPFNDTNALAMTTKRANELGIKTYTDLAQKASNLVIGGPPELFERPDGLPGLQKAYGGFNFKEKKQLDAGLRYPALQSGQVDVIRAFSTDGQLGSPDLVVLQDDKHFYPIYQIAPVIRQDTLQANPQIADILNKLAGPALDDKTMAKLNFMVDGPDKKEPAAVAKQWLADQGLIK